LNVQGVLANTSVRVVSHRSELNGPHIGGAGHPRDFEAKQWLNGTLYLICKI
jgi:hypothetical protein